MCELFLCSARPAQLFRVGGDTRTSPTPFGVEVGQKEGKNRGGRIRSSDTKQTTVPYLSVSETDQMVGPLHE